MSMVYDPYGEGFKNGYDQGRDYGYRKGCKKTEKLYDGIINKYKRFLDRLGIEFDPTKDNGK